METLLPFEKEKRKILVKLEAETSPEFGTKPEDKPIKDLLNKGIIVLNKPSGPTSHQVSDYVKKILNLKKAGHSGTLDPAVTGVLPVALGNSTRIVQALLNAGKEYVCLMHLHDDYPKNKIKEIINSFVGKIEQIPPVRSAVKRQKRQREIYYIHIYEIEGRDVLFKVGCEAGTYIRKLCVDIGKKLGSGAHMAELIRTKAGPFNDSQMITLHDLKDAYEFYKDGNDKELRKVILPIEKAVKHLPKIWILDTTVDSLCHGALLSTPGISKIESDINQGDMVAILTLKNELVGLGKAVMNSQNMLRQEKGIAVNQTKIFMERGTYPKFTSSQKTED